MNLPANKKYAYSIKKFVEEEEIWSIKDPDGWCLVGVEDQECVPVWPAKRYAETFIKESWPSAHCESITLDAWLERWIPGMSKDHRHVSVFLTSDMNSVVVSPERLEEDLLELEEEYYG